MTLSLPGKGASPSRKAVGAYPVGRQAYYLASELAIHADDAGVPVGDKERPGRTAWRARFEPGARARSSDRVSVWSVRALTLSTRTVTPPSGAPATVRTWPATPVVPLRALGSRSGTLVGRHLATFVEVVRYGQAVAAGLEPDRPTCACSCCPNWDAVAREAGCYERRNRVTSRRYLRIQRRGRQEGRRPFRQFHRRGAQPQEGKP